MMALVHESSADNAQSLESLRGLEIPVLPVDLICLQADTA